MKLKAIIIPIVVLAIAGVVGYGVYTFRNKDSASKIPKDAPSVEIESARKETIISKVGAKGTVSLIEQKTVYAKSSAKVAEMNLKVGDVIKEGDLLLTYDGKSLESLNEQLKDAQLAVKSAEIGLSGARTPASETEKLQAQSSIDQSKKTIQDIENQIEQANINLDQLKRSLATTEENLLKNKILYDNGLLTKAELEKGQEAITDIEGKVRTSESQKSGLAGTLNSAKNSLVLSEKQYSTVVNKESDPKIKTQINSQAVNLEQAKRNVEKVRKQINEWVKEERSPASGTILSISVAAGEMISDGRAIFVIADTSVKNLVITDFIPENESSTIALEQEVEISGGALGDIIYKGRVSKIYSTASRQQIGNVMETVITVEVTPTGEIPLKSGYTVDTDIITKVSEDVTVVPLMSVVTQSGDAGSYVFIVDEESKVTKRNVTLLTYSNLDVEIKEVAEGEKVVLNPPATLEDGAYVKSIAN